MGCKTSSITLCLPWLKTFPQRLGFLAPTVQTYDWLPENDSIHMTACLHLWVRMKRSGIGIFKDIGRSPRKPDSAVHNQVGQLAWDPVDVPSESLDGSRRLAMRLYLLLAPLPQTTLLVWAPSAPLSPACLLLYLETMWDSFKSFVLLFFNIAAVMCRCISGLFHHFNTCHGSFHAVSGIFVFWMIRKWLVASEKAMFILLMWVYSIKSLCSVRFWNIHWRRSSI